MGQKWKCIKRKLNALIKGHILLNLGTSKMSSKLTDGVKVCDLLAPNTWMGLVSSHLGTQQMLLNKRNKNIPEYRNRKTLVDWHFEIGLNLRSIAIFEAIGILLSEFLSILEGFDGIGNNYRPLGFHSLLGNNLFRKQTCLSTLQLLHNRLLLSHDLSQFSRHLTNLIKQGLSLLSHPSDEYLNLMVD